MAMMGFGEHCQALDRVDYPRLQQQFLEIERNAPAIQDALLIKAAEWRVLLEDEYAKILRVTGIA